ncbi:DUF885 domain-containing protein [Lacihabitans sp. LS3-19]|uniref:DUF885 domain-containing protein n=1 Tax=Lacihabitans sp. LS3-19 TaxID=2487335 RepID=UPI0020CFE4AF|nr:DUF885 domain-containing protein [Lacihabitans sp. LS3-19]MCP9770347.1 DUF885 domain-containing protein [Lacihabitans sp. LS3-19]
MKKIIAFVALSLLMGACKPKENEDLKKLFEQYYEERMSFFPLEATSQGDNRFDDKLPNNISEKFRKDLLAMYYKYHDQLDAIDTKNLNEDELIQINTLKFNINTEIEGLGFPTHLIPFDQFNGLPLTFAQLGSGVAAQPFKSTQDYDNWLKRVDQFAVWADTAIANFDKGIKAEFVLPKSLIVKMIPQMRDLAEPAATENLFYGPIKNLPATFTDAEKTNITTKYTDAIDNKIRPTYKKLADYLSTTYLNAGRPSSGIGSLRNGRKLYDYYSYAWTTTTKTPDEIFQTGLAEVTRIQKEMMKVKEEVGYKGDLISFFESVKTDPKLMPYKTPEEVLAAFKTIQTKIDPNLKKMFNNTPKTGFEIRRTEAFREASASAEYMQGSADGSRPGIFYIPIPDAKTFNITSGMESLFLHEAIPGHHYQISLQQENTTLPKFMRFGWYGAYGEGWALYCESLGKELGLYTDPYQYLGSLGDEMHRAIRLVVDVGIHVKGWSREEALAYMLKNEAISTDGAIAEIERYMAFPGQALSYKIGALKIKELRSKFQKSLGDKFNLAAFHDQVLKNGCLPLSVLEETMDVWAEKIAK